jgi:hypothetical protein
MSCMCLVKLQAFLASLKNLPLNALAALIPPDIPQLAMLGGLASGSATVSALASASAQAQLNAALRLGLPPFPIPMLDLGKLEAMASLVGAGVNPFSANASLQLSQMAITTNINLPSIMQMLMELLAPLIDPLMDLLALLQSFEAVHRTFNVNLAVPGAMPQLRLALAAQANLRLAARLDVTAAANLGAYARLMNASAALGINLAAPGAFPRLSAALQIAAGLPIPPLTINLPQMNTLANLLAALTPLQQSTLGINMRLPNAWDLLKAAIAALLANLAVPLNLSAMASLSETAALGSQLNAVPPALGLNLQAMASLRLSGLPFPKLPDFAPLAVAVRFGQATGLNVWSSSPCSKSCPMG